MELFFLAILVVLMAGALASGFPVAFALPGSAILTVSLAAICGLIFQGSADAYFAQGGAENWLTAGVTNFRGVYWEVERDTLIAIPLFVFMGIMLQRSKIAEDLLMTMAQLFGPVRGGLGISVVFVGALLAATTGILGATVVAMGLISLPAMMRNKYQNWLSTGTIAASGTLGQIIPPSIVLIILADQLSNAVDQAGATRQAMYKAATGEFSMPSEFAVTSTSAGDMFMGALLPGLVLVAVYMIFILVVSFIKRDAAPPVHVEGKFDKAFMLKVLIALFPPLTLIFIVLGSIITGIATVNQAGAVGAAGATIMAGYRLYDGHKRAYIPAALALVSLVEIGVVLSHYTVNVRAMETTDDVIGVILASIGVAGLTISLLWSGWRTIKVDNTMHGVVMETAKTTALVFIILLGAAMLTASFRGFGGEELVREFLQGLPGGFWMQFFIVMAVIFFLGFFLDFIEISVVVVPIVAPILLADPGANVTAVWLGVMIGMNIQTSFLTPPFGFALFYLRGVAPAIVKTIDIYKGVVPFICLQLVALVIVAYNPPLVNYLPTRMSLFSETAPPPANPRLQACIQQYTTEAFAANHDQIDAAITAAKALDLSSLPKAMQKDATKAFDLASKSFGALNDVNVAHAAIMKAGEDYSDILGVVRRAQRDIRAHDKDIENAKRDLGRLPKEEVEEIEKMKAHLATLEAEKVQLEAAIPASWKETRAEFKTLLTAEKKATGIYRRTVDDAYKPIQELLQTLESVPALEQIRGDVVALADVITSGGDTEAIQNRFKDVESELGTIANANDIRSALSKARRAMRGNNGAPDTAAALEMQAEAVAVLDREVQWRKLAATALLTPLKDYDSAIRGTIGIRQLDRLPRDVALYVVSCQADHTDISLYF